LAESLEFHGEIGDKLGISYCLCVRGVLAVEQSDFALGARLLGAAFGLHKPLEVQLTPRERAARDAALATARSVLGEEVFVRAWADGWGLPLEEAVAEASVLTGVLAAQAD
jgi:hypothetical protein